MSAPERVLNSEYYSPYPGSNPGTESHQGFHRSALSSPLVRRTVVFMPSRIVSGPFIQPGGTYELRLSVLQNRASEISHSNHGSQNVLHHLPSHFEQTPFSRNVKASSQAGHSILKEQSPPKTRQILAPAAIPSHIVANFITIDPKDF